MGEESTHDVYIPCELVAADVVTRRRDIPYLELGHERLERRGSGIGNDGAALGVARDQKRGTGDAAHENPPIDACRVVLVVDAQDVRVESLLRVSPGLQLGV